MRELHIFDLMSYVHAGHVNKRSFLSQTIRTGAGWETQMIPTGGASLLFNKLFELVGKADIVVVSDRNPTIKKDMIPGYKSNRQHKNDISVNKAATEYILQKCNIHLIARDGYEADDIAYSLVKDLERDYDRIYLYTGDSDWYFMVNRKVSIRKSSSISKDVDFDTFEAVTGYWYNSITLSKICDGDPGDCIPGLPKDASKVIQEKLLSNNLRGCLGNKDSVMGLFQLYFPQFTYQVDNVFPLYIEDLPHTFSQPDKKAICNFGAAIKNRLFEGRMALNFNVQEHVTYLCDKGIYLIEEGDVNYD